MSRLLLISLLVLSSCAVRYRARNAGGPNDPVTQPLVGTGVSPIGRTITIDLPAGEPMCGPDDADPQHTCPARAGPEQH